MQSASIIQLTFDSTFLRLGSTAQSLNISFESCKASRPGLATLAATFASVDCKGAVLSRLFQKLAKSAAASRRIARSNKKRRRAETGRDKGRGTDGTLLASFRESVRATGLNAREEGGTWGNWKNEKIRLSFHVRDSLLFFRPPVRRVFSWYSL